MNDDDLRARLRAADPARHLTHSADLELPEHAMTTSSSSSPARGRLVAVAAAAAVVLLAVAGLLLNRGGDDPAPTAQDEPSETTSPESTSSGGTDDFVGTGEFTINAGTQPARCAPPDARGMTALDAAFEGTVVSLDDEQVVLQPQKVYKGQPYDRAVLIVERTNAPSEVLPVDFKLHRVYIVGVKGGQVQLCGYTAEKGPMIEHTYQKVYPRPVVR